MQPLRAARVIALVTFASSCTSEQDLRPRTHRHPHDRATSARVELPKLPSRPLGYVPHASASIKIARPDLRHAGAVAVSRERQIAQRVLLLAATGEEPSFLAARDALDRIGMPYQPLIALEQEVTPELLGDGASACHFNAVLFATSGLAYFDDVSSAWTSALSPAAWERLAAFGHACGAREAIWYAWPSAELGLAHASTFLWTEEVDGRIRDPDFFRRVRSDAVIPIRHAAGYTAEILDPSRTTALIEDAGGGVLLALHTTADGREALISTVDGSPYLTHSLLLEHDMLRWLTGGMFVGDKRAYLSPQIDDIFLDNEMWAIGVGNVGLETFRITGSDVDNLVDWQALLRARLPSGSFFITSMAFNGAGAVDGVDPDPTLFAAARAAGSVLTWVNHTWSHANMDGLDYKQASAEIGKNCDLAAAFELAEFTCRTLVTPEVSGLTSAEALRAMADAGVRFVVSDTSVTEQVRPGAPGTNPSFNVGRTNPHEHRIYQVPRHPTNVFYDVATPEALTDEYNAIYHAYFGRELTYQELLDHDTAFGLFYLLQGDLDPLMFHQANLADYGDGRSLYADWIDTVANRFLALSTTPIRTLAQHELGIAMRERGRLDACGVRATVVESSAGRRLELVAGAGCTVPVTGLAAPEHGMVEYYGGDPITRIRVSGGSPVSVMLD
jgi:hypothetical protein